MASLRLQLQNIISLEKTGKHSPEDRVIDPYAEHLNDTDLRITETRTKRRITAAPQFIDTSIEWFDHFACGGISHGLPEKMQAN